MPVLASSTQPLSSLCSSLASNKARLQVHTHTHKDVQQSSARRLEKSRGWYERYTHSLSISVQLLHPHVLLLLLLLLSLLNSRWVWLGQRKPQGGRDEHGVDPRDVTQVLELLLKFNSSLITVILLQLAGPEQANFVWSGHTISFIGVCAHTQSRGVWGHAPQGNFQNVHPLKHVFNEILYQNTVQSERKKPFK